VRATDPEYLDRKYGKVEGRKERRNECKIKKKRRRKNSE
jgi:hypothetical protein